MHVVTALCQTFGRGSQVSTTTGIVGGLWLPTILTELSTDPTQTLYFSETFLSMEEETRMNRAQMRTASLERLAHVRKRRRTLYRQLGLRTHKEL